MNLRSRRLAERPTASVLFCARQWGDRPRAWMYRKARLVCVPLPVRTRCRAVRRRNIKMRWDGQHQKVRVCPWPFTTYCANFMLRSPVRDEAALGLLVEQAIARGVKLIAAVGPTSLGTCIDVDKLIVGDEYDPSRFILTTSHETTLEAIEYIKVSRSRVRFSEIFL